MTKPVGEITWIGRNSGLSYRASALRAVFLLGEDNRAAVRAMIECDYGTHRYGIRLTRTEGNHFVGSYQKSLVQSKQLIAEREVTCSLYDSGEADALFLGTSAWVDDGGWEWDWCARFTGVERVPHEEWHSALEDSEENS